MKEELIFQLIKNEESVNLYEANTIATVNMGTPTYEPQTSKLAVAVALQLLTAPGSLSVIMGKIPCLKWRSLTDPSEPR